MVTANRHKNQRLSNNIVFNHTDEIIEVRNQLEKESHHRFAKKMAVLFTDVQGSSAYFKTHGDTAGRIMLQKHNNMLFPIIGENVGVIIKTIGDSIMASFENPKMAVKSAAEMQKRLFDYNRNRSRKNQIHIRIGINYGDIIVEDNDIFGDVVNMTSRILCLAKPDHILVSENIYNTMEETEGALFRSVNIEIVLGESEKIKVYDVIWKEDLPIVKTATVMSLKVVNQKQNNEKSEDWMNSWAETCFDLVIPIIYRNTSRLIAKSGVELLSIFEGPITPVKVARKVVEVVREHNSKRPDKEPIEFQIFIDTGGIEIDSDKEEDSIKEIANARNSFGGLFQPNEVYITNNTYDFLKDVDKIEGEPAVVSAEGKVLLYQIRWIEPKQKQDIKLFEFRKHLKLGDYQKCFYCGCKKHPVCHCPSKTIWNSPDRLSELGHLSFPEVNALFVNNVESIIEPREPREENNSEKISGGADMAFEAFFELSRPFQLHFLKRIWHSKARRWSEIEKIPREVKQEGGSLWLALDSIRVSKLERAETILKAEKKRNPNDYRVFTAFAFLNIERGDLAQTLDYFEKAMICADTSLQKGYIALLAFRAYETSEMFNEARQKIEEALTIMPDCLEARYMKAVLIMRMGKYQRGIQEIRRIIEEEPSFYVKTMLDPSLTFVEDQIEAFLLGLFEDARDKAIESKPQAKKAVARLKEWLGPTNEKCRDNMASLDEISTHMKSNSYIGFIDAAALAENIWQRSKMILQNQRKMMKEKIFSLVSKLIRELEYVKTHPLKRKLGRLSFSLKTITDELSKAKSNTVFIETPAEFKEARLTIKRLSECSREMAPIIKKLQRCEKVQYVLNESKKISVFVLGGLAVGSVLFPLITYYMAYFSSNFQFVIEKFWKHQGLAIFTGVIVGLIIGVIKVILDAKNSGGTPYQLR